LQFTLKEGGLMGLAELYNQVWDGGNYRAGSGAKRLLPFFHELIPEGSVVNDYGSGTGRVEKGLLEFCEKVHMVDFADNALEAEAKALIGDRLTYIVSPLESLPEDFPYADWGLCIGVLMLIDPEKLDAILGEMKRTCENLIVAVYDRVDERLGVDLTTVKHDNEWWVGKLSEYWSDVSWIPGREASHKHIQICKNS